MIIKSKYDYISVNHDHVRYITDLDRAHKSTRSFRRFFINFIYMLKLKNIKTLAKRLLELFRFAKYLRKCIIYELIERDRRPLAKCGS